MLLINDQILKIGQIFASLESFLNEVVDSTCKTLRKNTRLRNSQTSHTLGRRLSQDYDVFKNKHEGSSEREECLSQAAKRLFDKSQSDHLDTLLNKKKLKYLEITDFLKKIGLNQYEKNFLLNGYDDINFLVIIFYLINFQVVTYYIFYRTMLLAYKILIKSELRI